jgi:hypothetical protein
MKAQIALFEVMLSSIAISTLVSLLAGTLYTSPLTTGAYNLGYSNMFYDFANAVYRNGTMGTCFATGNYTCELRFMKTLDAVYGMDYVEFGLGDSRVSYGSSLFCARFSTECLPIRQNGTFSVGCLYACGA